MKYSQQIKKWGVIKPYFDKTYNFNTLDLETVENELFLLGVINNGKYQYYLNDFFNKFHDFLISSVQQNKDILTWSRYDNTHLLKLIFNLINDNEKLEKTLLKVGKVTPIYEYNYKTFTFTLYNVIKDSIIFKLTDLNGKSRNCTIYNLKNLFTSDLENTAKNYEINSYSKLGVEYHIIDKKRFNDDKLYRDNVILSNKLDNQVLIDIANRFLTNFKNATGVYPKSIFTAGSIARSFLLAFKDDFGSATSLSFKNIYGNNRYHDILLDYSMRSYHGGKVEVYAIGKIKKGYIIDITSAYPYAMSLLPKLTNKVKLHNNINDLDKYYYAFIRCNIYIKDKNLIHPIIFKAPTNDINISPYGYMRDTIITKIEYDFLIKNGAEIEVINFIGIESDNNDYPYKNLVDYLFNKRLTAENKSLSDLYKTIINSLYGITYELTDIHTLDDNDNIVWQGYRAGDYFNPIIASYITAIVRSMLCEVDNNIIKNGGEIYLNMTDSIIYNGNVTLNVFSDEKVLGKFSKPQELKNIYIMGTGRYEYQEVDTNKFIVKNRGFIAKETKEGFYSKMKLEREITIPHDTFVTIFKSTTQKYGFDMLGHITSDDYVIKPFNIGGKRIVVNDEIDLNKTFTKTIPLYLDKYY